MSVCVCAFTRCKPVECVGSRRNMSGFFIQIKTIFAVLMFIAIPHPFSRYLFISIDDFFSRFPCLIRPISIFFSKRTNDFLKILSLKHCLTGYLSDGNVKLKKTLLRKRINLTPLEMINYLTFQNGKVRSSFRNNLVGRFQKLFLSFFFFQLICWNIRWLFSGTRQCERIFNLLNANGFLNVDF